MNISSEYIQWNLGLLTRNDIVDIADKHISTHDYNNDPRIIDISVSMNEDDYSFEKLVLQFVGGVDKGVVLKLVRDKLKGADIEDLKVFLPKLHAAICDWGMGPELDEVYWRLDHYINECLENGWVSEDRVLQFVHEWCKKSA
jgi:hypothetical protein